MMIAVGLGCLCISVLLTMILLSNVTWVPVNHRVKEIKNMTKAYWGEKIEGKESKPRHRKTMIDQYEEWLRECDYPFGLTASSYALVQVSFTIFVFMIISAAVVQSELYSTALTGLIPRLLVWLAIFFVTLLIFMVPYGVLQGLASSRRRKLERQFLYLLNYFQVFTRAKILPDQILRECVQMIPNPLQRRIIELLADIKLKPEAEAYTAFANRLKFKEAELFVNAMISSIKMGSDVSELCVNIAKQMRDDRKHKQILKIQKKPFFILIPKVCFVIAILIVLIVPIIDMLNNFANI